MNNLDQQRADNALSCVDRLRDQPEEFRKLYRAYSDRLGPTIVMNGLGQALATEQAAAGAVPEPASAREHAHKTLYDNVQRWLCRENGGVYAASDDLLTAIMKEDESHYLRAQAEALAWLEWHKKFCRALLPKGDGGED